MNVGSNTHYSAAPGETTEWDDIQRRLGNLPALPTQAESSSDESDTDKPDPLASKTREELDELEEEDFADSRALERYREQRLAEMRAKASVERFGKVYEIVKSDFIREVTEASHKVWVIVHLHQDAIERSNVLAELLAETAAKHRAVKFVRIQADKCIEGYPDSNVPTVVIYHDGELVEQLVGLAPWGGNAATADCIEWVLSKSGALTTDLEEDPRHERRLLNDAARRSRR